MLALKEECDAKFQHSDPLLTERPSFVCLPMLMMFICMVKSDSFMLASPMRKRRETPVQHEVVRGYFCIFLCVLPVNPTANRAGDYLNIYC